MTACLHCGAETTNGLVLCELVTRKADTDLEFIPIYHRNLSRWKPGASGRRTVPGSRQPTLTVGSDDDVMRTLDEVTNDLVTWARALFDDRGLRLPALVDDSETTSAAAACRVLREHLTSIGTLEWAGEFVRRLAEHEETLRLLTEAVAPGWYAGECHRCHAPTHVVPGLTWVTCTGCTMTTYARDHLDTLLAEAREWRAPSLRMAEAIVALVDTEHSIVTLHERIRKWGQRGKVSSSRRVDAEGSGVGPKLYVLGEVLDRVLCEVRLPAARRGA